MSEALPAPATLACQPARDGDHLVFPYRLTNTGSADIYVFDAVPGWDPAANAARLDPDAAYVSLGADGFAHVLRGIAPLPTDMSVAVRVIPLAVRLAPGASLERSLALSQPLHETGPYHPDLPVRQYRQKEIAGVVLTVQYLPATVPGFGAAPSELGPGLFRVMAADTVGASRSAVCRMPARGLSILQRTDAFPRPE